MTYNKVISFFTVLLFCSSVSAKMVTPEDPYHRYLENGSRGAKAERSVASEKAKPASLWGKLKSKVTDTASYYWNYSENKEKEKQLAIKKAKQEEEQRKVETLAESLPVAEQASAKESFQNLLEETKSEVVSKDAIAVANPGRKGSSDLKATTAGVPQFDLVKAEKKKQKDGQVKTVKIKVKKIPKLDIGEERSIVSSELLPSQTLVLNPVTDKAKALKTPKSVSEKIIAGWVNKDIQAVAKWKGPKDNEYGLGKIVTNRKIEKVDVEMTPEKVMAEIRDIHKFDKNDRKMLMALILNQQGDKCHIASGLFKDLTAVQKYNDEAKFHLGVCAHKMGFHSEAVARLLEVIKTKKSEYLSEAIENIVENLPSEYEEKVAKALRPYEGSKTISKKAKDYANYIFARAAYKQRKYTRAAKKAGEVQKDHSYYYKAQYLKGISLYAKKDSRGEKTLEGLLKSMKKKGKQDKNLVALANINLGRMKFLQKRYEAALMNYKSVPKNHPVWVDALIEQGWIQLNTNDAPGAIGNMYSLHSPYFRSVYMPESWVVRTIGYIDICQYGDAYRSLTKLETEHSSYVNKVGAYLKSKPSSNKMYTTVKNYIRGKSHKDVDGLPAQVIREVARQQRFLNHQNAMNIKVDEVSQYKFISSIINKDIRDLKQRRTVATERKKTAKANIASIANKPELEKNRQEWQSSIRADTALIRRLSYQIEVYSDGRSGYKRMRKVAESRIKKDKAKLRNKAGRVLLSELKKKKQDLQAILEGNEFLRYEIFAGSGEDIRYQAAGGKTQKVAKIPANIKPKKILNWQFDGEYWEDEIGSYRSTLTNNCPKRARSTAAIRK